MISILTGESSVWSTCLKDLAVEIKATFCVSVDKEGLLSTYHRSKSTSLYSSLFQKKT